MPTELIVKFKVEVKENEEGVYRIYVNDKCIGYAETQYFQDTGDRIGYNFNGLVYKKVETAVEAALASLEDMIRRYIR